MSSVGTNELKSHRQRREGVEGQEEKSRITAELNFQVCPSPGPGPGPAVEPSSSLGP